MILRNRRSASSIPAAVQRTHMSPFCQRLTLREVARQMPIMDSIGFVEDSVFQSCRCTRRRCSVTVSARPSRSDAAAPGCECASSPASASRRSIAGWWSLSFQAARSRPLIAVQAAVDEVSEQLDADALVLRQELRGRLAGPRAARRRPGAPDRGDALEPQPGHDLRAGLIDPHRRAATGAQGHRLPPTHRNQRG